MKFRIFRKFRIIQSHISITDKKECEEEEREKSLAPVAIKKIRNKKI